MPGYVMPKKAPAAKTARGNSRVVVSPSKNAAPKGAFSATPTKKGGSFVSKAAPSKVTTAVSRESASGQFVSAQPKVKEVKLTPNAATLRAIAEADAFAAAFKKRHGGA